MLSRLWQEHEALTTAGMVFGSIVLRHQRLASEPSLAVGKSGLVAVSD